MEDKMRILNNDEIEKLSFPDYHVEFIHIDDLKKIAKIETDGAYLLSTEGIRLKKCELTIKNWQSIDIALYRASTKQWENLSLSNIDNLSDICEFEYGKDIIFRGFGQKTGQWIELKFKNSSIEVKCY